jgi:hypothetical protein
VLNRAEWIKFVSVFFNKEDVANAQFDAISSVGTRYRNGGRLLVAATTNESMPAAGPFIPSTINPYLPAFQPCNLVNKRVYTYTSIHQRMPAGLQLGEGACGCAGQLRCLSAPAGSLDHPLSAHAPVRPALICGG